MGRAAVRGALLLAALVLWLPAAAQAQAPAEITLVSNTGQAQGLLNFRGDYAQGFRTGMTRTGYVLSALELRMRSADSATMSNLTVTLRNASGDNPDSMVLATFVNPDSPALSTTRQTFRFTLSEGEELDPNTPYFIHLSNNHASDSIEVLVTTSNNQDPGGLDDWGIDDIAKMRSASWMDITSFAVQLRLDGYAKTPAPVLRTAEVNGGALVLTYGEALDATSVPAAAAFTVTVGGAAVSVSTVSVSGMAVTLGLASAVTAEQTVQLDYVVPSLNPLQNGSGSDVGALAGQAVLNQTPAAGLVWTSAVTIGDLPRTGEGIFASDNGYNTDLALGSVGGALIDGDFEYSGSTYTVKALFAATWGVIFVVDRAGLPDTLTLELAHAQGTWTIAFSDKADSSTPTRWNFESAAIDGGSDFRAKFEVGQVATVCLRSTTATNACPAARYGAPSVPMVPMAPSAPTVSAVSGQSDRLSVSWTAPSDGGSAIKDYDVRYCQGATTACTTDAAFTEHVFTGTATAETIVMLMAETEYQVQVRATNAEGTGPWSASGAGTTAAELLWTSALTIENLGVPGGGGGYNSDTTLMSVNTTLAVGGSLTDDDFEYSGSTYTVRALFSTSLAIVFEVDPAGLPDTLTLELGSAQGAWTIAFSDRSLIHSTSTRWHFLRSTFTTDTTDPDDHFGMGKVATVCLRTARQTCPAASYIDAPSVPSAPSAPMVSAVSGQSDRLSVSWTAPANTDPPITDYDVRYCQGAVAACTADTDFSEHAFIGTATAATITTLMAATEHQVQVRATNDTGTGPWSASGAGTTEAVPAQADLMWMSAVTIENLGAAGGYNNDAMFMLNMNTTLAMGGSLTDGDFEYSGSTYTVKALFSTSQAVVFEVDQAGLPDTLTLELANAQGTWTIAFSDKIPAVSTSTRWYFESTATGTSDPRSVFGNGKVATVCLRTATRTCPAASYGDPLTAPLAPSAPTVSAVSGQSDRLSVSWMAPSDGGSAITDYDVQYCQGTMAACTTDADFTGHDFTGTATAATIAMLMAETEYQVQVRATNAVGTGPWSASGAGTTAAAEQAELEWTSAVTIENLHATVSANGYNSDATLAIGSTTLAVSGSLTNGDFEYSGSTYTVKALFATSLAVYFEVDRAGLPDTLTLELASAQGTWTIAFSDKTPAVSTSTRWYLAGRFFTSDNADPITEFAVSKVATVCLRTATRTCPSARYIGAPSAPSAPTVSAVSGQSDRLSVSWTAPSDGGSAITDYDVRYCQGTMAACTTDADFTGHDFTGTSTTTTIAMLMAAAEHQVQVRATNDTGTGPWSASGAGTTAAAQDTGLLARARQAWLARFGRTVAGQVAEAVAARLSAPAGPQAELNLGGSAPEAALLSGALQALGGEARPDPRRTLADSSFVLALSDSADGGWTAWGEGAYAEFDGTDGDLEIDGEVAGATVGLDREQGRWRWGLALSRSEGDGEVHEAEGSRIDYESSLAGVHPYARWHGDGGLSAWGVLGWGEGELEETSDGERSETDLEMRMAALGATGPLGAYESAFGEFGLNLKSEAMAVRMEADADAAMPEVAADASRLRLLLEGVGHRPLESGGLLAPRLEAGLRWDGGDAETGLGAEIGAALRYVDPSGQLSAEFTARALLAHEEIDYDEWGVSGALRLEPDRAGRGLSLKLESGYGPTGSGLDELWRRRDLAGLAPQGKVTSAGRLEAELGYGLNSPGGRGILVPYAAYRGDDGELSLGARLDSGETLSLDISALRRRRGEEQNGIEFRVDARW